MSYAHVDDEPPPGIEQGWISTFVAGFKTYLAKALGRRDLVRLWMDYEMRGNEPVTPAIHDRLASVQVLLLFLSKGYLSSSWCLEELETFHQRHGFGSGRIFPVHVSPVDDLPDALTDLLRYRFWREDQAGEPQAIGDPVRSAARDLDYYQGLRRVAWDMARTLSAEKARKRGQCGLARPRVLAGESLASVVVRREPSIEPCGAAGNRRVDA